MCCRSPCLKPLHVGTWKGKEDQDRAIPPNVIFRNVYSVNVIFRNVYSVNVIFRNVYSVNVIFCFRIKIILTKVVLTELKLVQIIDSYQLDRNGNSPLLVCIPSDDN